MSREAMKQALEALEKGVCVDPEESHRAIYALRQALAEPEQEPVAWISESENLLSWDKFYDHMKPLYTAPTPHKPLTDEEIDRVTDQQWAQNNHKPIYAAHRAYARAIEAKLKEKSA